MERRYASDMNTMFIVFTYAYGLPVLPFVSSIMLCIQYVVDKLMITYYFKERIENNDLLNRTSLRLIKYGIVLFFFFGAYAMAGNYCTVYNESKILNYATEYVECRHMYT